MDPYKTSEKGGGDAHLVLVGTIDKSIITHTLLRLFTKSIVEQLNTDKTLNNIHVPSSVLRVSMRDENVVLLARVGLA
jgi:hypothetical protein